MLRKCATALATACLLMLTACQTVTEQRRPVALAIANVTVIDPETRRSSEGRSVYVDGDRIVAIVPAGTPTPYAAAKVVDGTGKYLIPGLMDMHVHLFLPEPSTPSLNLLLANGVTGIREMSGDCWEAAGATKGCIADYRALQARLKSGEVAGPDIVKLASTMVMGPTRLKLPEGAPSFITPRTEEDARLLVDHLQNRGPDLIKTHDSIPTAAFEALMEEARLRNIEVSGHIPFRAGVMGAVGMGFKSIEHARDLLYDCSSYGPDFRRAEADYADGLAGAARPSNLVRLTRTVEGYDSIACAALGRALAKEGTFYVPTHVTREMEARAGEASYRSDPNRKYVLPARDRNWQADLDSTAALPPTETEALGAFFRHGLTVTGIMHRENVPIMAGTDANDTMIVPGFSLHRELGLLVQAGMSPMEALRSATSVPAAYLGKTDIYGGVSPGKEADLVLLDANPLDDIGNSRSIVAVIVNGRLLDRAALDALMAEVERMAAAATP